MVSQIKKQCPTCGKLFVAPKGALTTFARCPSCAAKETAACSKPRRLVVPMLILPALLLGAVAVYLLTRPPSDGAPSAQNSPGRNKESSTEAGTQEKPPATVPGKTESGGTDGGSGTDATATVPWPPHCELTMKEREAWGLAKAAVRGYLKNPDSGSFPELGAQGTSVRRVGDQIIVEGYVAAVNELGNTCRSNFRCVVGSNAGTGSGIVLATSFVDSAPDNNRHTHPYNVGK